MGTLGASLERIGDGEVVIRLAGSPRVSQQHGFVHAGAVAAVADSACGYACLTKMPADAAVLSVEFKINLLAPAPCGAGDSLLAHAKVVRAGRTISVASCEVWAEPVQGERKMVALMQATMMRVEARAGVGG